MVVAILLMRRPRLTLDTAGSPMALYLPYHFQELLIGTCRGSWNVWADRTSCVRETDLSRIHLLPEVLLAARERTTVSVVDSQPANDLRRTHS